MNIKNHFIAAAFLVSGMLSCKSIEFRKTSGGIPYKVYPSSRGDSVKPNSVVKLHVIQRTRDTVLFSSYEQEIPQYLQVQPPSSRPPYADIASNVMEVLPTLKVGDSAYFTQSADSLLAGNPQMAMMGYLKKGDQLITTVRILEVFNNPDDATASMNREIAAGSVQREKESLERFLADTSAQAQMAIDNRIIEQHLQQNGITAMKTPWGVYVQIIEPGQGPKPQPGQFVSVKYNGMDLSGKSFDSGTYPLQIGTGRSIQGFEEGVKQLAKGGKAKIFIPSRLGYGERGSGQTIAPNQILVFEMEIMEISDKQPLPEGHSADDGHGH